MFVKKFLVFVSSLAGIQFARGYDPQKTLQTAPGSITRLLHQNQLLFLSVYYESRCPDSKAFVLRQLKPALELLPDYIMLRMVPFGKAKSIEQGYHGFECQHGPSECLGNVIQNCVLDLMMGQPDTKKLDYVACEMKTFAATNGDLSCVQQAHISPGQVKQCVTSGKGTDLQLEAEFLTKLVHPKFVPTITIDGIFNQQIQDHALVDLVGTLCSLLKETKECAQYYNNMAMNYVLLPRA